MRHVLDDECLMTHNESMTNCSMTNNRPPPRGRTGHQAFVIPHSRALPLITSCETFPSALRSSTFVKPLTSYTISLSDVQAAALKAWLEAHNYKFRGVPYARFAAEKDKTYLVFYESGKLVIQGKGTQ